MGKKIRAKLAPLTEKKKCYLTSKIRDVGVIAWTLEREHFHFQINKTVIFPNSVSNVNMKNTLHLA